MIRYGLSHLVKRIGRYLDSGVRQKLVGLAAAIVMLQKAIMAIARIQKSASYNTVA